MSLGRPSCIFGDLAQQVVAALHTVCGHRSVVLQVFLLNPAAMGLRDSILTSTNDACYVTRPEWRHLHHLTHCRDFQQAPCLLRSLWGSA